MDKFKEGYDAFLQDLDPSDCPYYPGSESYESWVEGWEYAYDEYNDRGVPSGGGEIEMLLPGLVLATILIGIVGVIYDSFMA